MEEKVRSVSEAQAKLRIETLRKYKGDLINAVNSHMDPQNMDNVFLNST